MAFSKSRTQKTVQKLLGITAGDARRDVTFIKRGNFNYSTQSSSDTSFVVKNAVITSFKGSEYQNDNIESGDLKLICEIVDGNPDVNTDDTDCEIDGVLYDIIDTKDGPMKTFSIMQLRTK